MNDLDLLKELPGPVDPPDEVTKDRMRTLMEARMAPGHVRRPRPVMKASMLGIAAALAAASLAAAIAIHPWTTDRPVAIGIGSPVDNGFGGQISDPDGPITTAADLEAAVAEFAPAIRLPEGGSFAQWTQHFEADFPPGGLRAYLDRASVVSDMVFVSQCQWGQRWLDASAQGDRAAAEQATVVLSDLSEWMRAAVLHDDTYMAALLAQMRNGQMSGVQMFEDAGCAYTGSRGTTPSQQDAKATGTLMPGIRIAQNYLRDGGDPGTFDRSKAGNLAPNVTWTSSDMQPVPASPGAVFIAQSADAGVTLVSVSESGTQFCAVVTDTAVEHGTTTHDLSVVPDGDGAKAAVPGPVICTPGGW